MKRLEFYIEIRRITIIDGESVPTYHHLWTGYGWQRAEHLFNYYLGFVLKPGETLLFSNNIYDYLP